MLFQLYKCSFKKIKRFIFNSACYKCCHYKDCKTSSNFNHDFSGHQITNHNDSYAGNLGSPTRIQTDVLDRFRPTLGFCNIKKDTVYPNSPACDMYYKEKTNDKKLW